MACEPDFSLQRSFMKKVLLTITLSFTCIIIEAQVKYTEEIQMQAPGQGKIVLHQSKTITDLVNAVAPKSAPVAVKAEKKPAAEAEKVKPAEKEPEKEEKPAKKRVFKEEVGRPLDRSRLEDEEIIEITDFVGDRHNKGTKRVDSGKSDNTKTDGSK